MVLVGAARTLCRSGQRAAIGLKSQSSFVRLSSSSSSSNSGTTVDVMRPSTWKGLSREEIIANFKERKLRSQGNYEFDQDELKLLMSTADDEISAEEIKKLYYGGEQYYIDYKSQGINRNHYRNDFSSTEPAISSLAHNQIRAHRVQRRYNRIAAYELPQLVKFRSQYVPRDRKASPLKFKFFNYLGEQHPASSKVVVTFSPKDLNLTETEAHKLRLLAGKRYMPEQDEVKISSNLFSEPAQNMKYLSNVINNLLAEAKDATDTFADIPLDTRHAEAHLRRHKTKLRGHAFPEEWKRPEDAPSDKKPVTLREALGLNIPRSIFELV